MTEFTNPSDLFTSRPGEPWSIQFDYDSMSGYDVFKMFLDITVAGIKVAHGEKINLLDVTQHQIDFINKYLAMFGTKLTLTIDNNYTQEFRNDLKEMLMKRKMGDIICTSSDIQNASYLEYYYVMYYQPQPDQFVRCFITYTGLPYNIPK